jgi:hypothetical protein
MHRPTGGEEIGALGAPSIIALESRSREQLWVPAPDILVCSEDEWSAFAK